MSQQALRGTPILSRMWADRWIYVFLLPTLTLVGAFAGVRMFGLIGAFLGPLLLSYFIELLDVYDAARRAETP